MFLRLIASAGLVALATTAASAQQFGIPQGPAQADRPAVSPYLNLLRPGAPAYLNYYGLVRPQQQALQNQQQMQSQFSAFSDALNGLQNSPYTGLGGGLATGHGFGFQTHRGYFQNLGGSAAGFGTLGGVGGPGAFGGGGFGAPAGFGGAGGFGRGGAAGGAFNNAFGASNARPTLPFGARR